MWATPVFRNDFRHPVDLSAFLSSSPVHMPPEDPPPYSEQLLEGHITLMYGSKPESHKDDADIDQDPNNTLLTVRDVSLLNNLDYRGEFGPSTRAENTLRDADADSDHNDTSQPLASSPSFRDNSPFNGSPAQVLVPPVFQRPYRSSSLDNSSVVVFPDGTYREQPTANAVRPFIFPPRLSPINNNQLTHSIQALPFLRDEVAPNQLFPARPPPRLPPLRGSSAMDMSSQHRKRNKRRRGHSWHGEAINITARETSTVNPCTMTTVTE